MSCSVVVVPLALAKLLVALPIIVRSSQLYNVEETVQNDIVNCKDNKILLSSDIVEKTYETPFLDKELLLKELCARLTYHPIEKGLALKAPKDMYNLNEK